MITYDDCLPCLERQATEACDLADLDQSPANDVLDAVRAKLASFSRARSPVDMAVEIHALVHDASGNADPNAAIKTAREALREKPQGKPQGTDLLSRCAMPPMGTDQLPR